MTWDDVDEILHDGTEEEIKGLKCPDCGGKIRFAYGEESNSLSTKCEGCGMCTRSHGSPYRPNCAKYQ